MLGIFINSVLLNSCWRLLTINDNYRNEEKLCDYDENCCNLVRLKNCDRFIDSDSEVLHCKSQNMVNSPLSFKHLLLLLQFLHKLLQHCNKFLFFDTTYAWTILSVLLGQFEDELILLAFLCKAKCTVHMRMK